MMWRRGAVAVFAVIVTAVWATPALAEPNTVDVVVKTTAGSLNAAAEGTGGKVVKTVTHDTAVVRVPGPNPSIVAKQMMTRAGVEWAEPEMLYSATREPNDTCYSGTCLGQTQWGPRKVNAPAAWDKTTTAPGVKIAVIDSGVDVTHSDLDSVVQRGPNFSSDSNNNDEFGHGTHVAGVIGAETNNLSGIAGIIWNADMVSVKVLDRNGDAFGSSVAQSLIWAGDNGVDVANLSFTGGNTRVVADAVAYAQSKGVLVVAAAGNSSSGEPAFPAAYENVLSVGATNADDTRASYSNFGTWVKISAPGTDIISTWPLGVGGHGQYRVMSGTSMATPVVAGAAGLVWAQHPYMSAAGVMQRLTDTVDQMPGSGTVVASGRLNLDRAMSSVGNGYRLSASDGGVFNFGDASFNGSAGSLALNRPIVAMATRGTTDGYWLFASDGGVFSYGGAGFYGSTGGSRLNQPIVGAAPTRGGNGYWLVASDGGVFSFGDARFFGSTGGTRLNQPIVGASRSASGSGYWLVASDGGVFSFGDAQFRGSTGGMNLNKPIVSIAPSMSGNGYLLVASDGGIFAYGDAVFRGSTGGERLNSPVVAAAAQT